MPLTFVDNCAEAIVLAGLRAGINGEVFNVVDDELPTGRQFLKAYRNKAKSLLSIRLPYVVGYTMCLLWEKYSSGQKNSYPLFLIGAAALPSGKEIATPTRNSKNGWAGSRGSRWTGRWRRFWRSLHQTETMTR